jgi:hypothetical protein
MGGKGPEDGKESGRGGDRKLMNQQHEPPALSTSTPPQSSSPLSFSPFSPLPSHPQDGLQRFLGPLPPLARPLPLRGRAPPLRGPARRHQSVRRSSEQGMDRPGTPAPSPLSPSSSSSSSSASWLSQGSKGGFRGRGSAAATTTPPSSKPRPRSRRRSSSHASTHGVPRPHQP